MIYRGLGFDTSELNLKDTTIDPAFLKEVRAVFGLIPSSFAHRELLRHHDGRIGGCEIVGCYIVDGPTACIYIRVRESTLKGLFEESIFLLPVDGQMPHFELIAVVFTTTIHRM